MLDKNINVDMGAKMRLNRVLRKVQHKQTKKIL